MSPILMVHISGGTMGLVSGAAALSFRKGSRWHVRAGKVFVVSMLAMAAGAIPLAILKHETGNVVGGVFTFYLTLTAWWTARRTDGAMNKLGWAVLLIPVVVGALNWFSGIEKLLSPGPPKDGVPAGMNLFLGSVMLMAAAGDVRVLIGGGIVGTKRVARHLWRMCFGLFIASGSFFLGGSNRPLRLLSTVGLGKYLSPAVFNTPLYLVLTILPLILLIFWLVRVRFTNAYNGKTIVPGRPAPFVEQRPAP